MLPFRVQLEATEVQPFVTNCCLNAARLASTASHLTYNPNLRCLLLAQAIVCSLKPTGNNNMSEQETRDEARLQDLVKKHFAITAHVSFLRELIRAARARGESFSWSQGPHATHVRSGTSMASSPTGQHHNKRNISNFACVWHLRLDV